MAHRLVIIDNNKKGFRADRKLGFIKAYRDFFGNEQGLHFMPYTQLDLQVLNDAGGVILSGSKRDIKLRIFKKEIAFILETQKPLLGVCFGHQLIAYAFGIEREECDKEHGTFPVTIEPGFDLHPPGQIQVELAHHQAILKSAALEVHFNVFATTKEAIVQAMQHKDRPIYGTQFHPETAIESARPYGMTILRNFFKLLR
ncbi:MAG: gamma-glutamyl-gamma-aminobutyrate hydrolase family protein [Candidatus Sigynarchaeota archaeon]